MAISVNYSPDGIPDGTPTYLFDQAEKYKEDPHEAAMQWFLEANLGLSVFYGLSSLTGTAEDACCREGWDKDAYRKLKDIFACKNFEANEIVELAIAAGARYVSMPACFRDGFALFNTAVNDFNSVKAVAQRDLVGEMACMCEYHGLGLHLVYSLGFNAQNLPVGTCSDEEWNKHLEIARDQLHELLVNYGPIAAISLDGIEYLQENAERKAQVQDLYDMMHALQPQVLVGCQQGLLGTEDFHSVSRELPTAESELEAQGFVLSRGDKPVEIRHALANHSRLSYDAEAAGKHLTTEDIWALLTKAQEQKGNLLLNTALMPDGSLDLEDINHLLEIGERLEKHGLPRV